MSRLKHACRINFGPFRGRTIEALVFDSEGYEFLYHFSKERGQEDCLASLRAFARRILAMADEKPVVTRTCDCGNVPKFAKYFTGRATIFESLHCEQCKPDSCELGQYYWLVPLVFSSQRLFRNPDERKRFVRFLTTWVGMSRPITANRAFAFFFPVEAAAQRQEREAQIPECLRDRPPRPLGFSLC